MIRSSVVRVPHSYHRSRRDAVTAIADGFATSDIAPWETPKIERWSTGPLPRFVVTVLKYRSFETA